MVKLRVLGVAHGRIVSKKAMVMQQKTHQPVQLEITEQTREAISNLIKHAKLTPTAWVFKSRLRKSLHLSTRQYARIVKSWGLKIRFDSSSYGTHSFRQTKPIILTYFMNFRTRFHDH